MYKRLPQFPLSQINFLCLSCVKREGKIRSPCTPSVSLNKNNDNTETLHVTYPVINCTKHWAIKHSDSKTAITLTVQRSYQQTGIARWLESRTRDRSVASSNPGRSGGTISSSRIIFVCWLLFGVFYSPVLPQWHVKDPRYSAQSTGGRLHLNTHTPFTWCAQANLHFKKKKKKRRRGMNGRTFSQIPRKRGQATNIDIKWYPTIEVYPEHFLVNKVQIW